MTDSSLLSLSTITLYCFFFNDTATTEIYTLSLHDALPIHRWAQGESLEDVLHETDMSPGDFVRTCKQVLDLLRQIEEVAPERVADLVRCAREAVNRGVVAYTGV